MSALRKHRIEPVRLIGHDIEEALDMFGRPKLSSPGRVRGRGGDSEAREFAIAKAWHLHKLVQTAPRMFRDVITMWHDGYAVDEELLGDAFDYIADQIDIVDEISEAD